MMDSGMISRRGFGIGIGLTGTGLAGTSLRAATSMLDRPEGVLEALVRMRGAGEGQIACWWLTETVYGVVGNQITPLYAGHVGSLVKTSRRADGVFDLAQFETAFWTTLDGKTDLTTFKNPYTGADNRLTPLVMGPHTVRLTVAGTEAPPPSPGGKMAFESNHGPVVEVGDDVFISSDVKAVVTFDDPAKPSRAVNDLATYQARRSDLAGSADFIPSWVTFQSIASWPTALNMGGRDGHMVARAAGAKVGTLAEMPETWRRLASVHAPDLLKDPEAVMARAPARLD